MVAGDEAAVPGQDAIPVDHVADRRSPGRDGDRAQRRESVVVDLGGEGQGRRLVADQAGLRTDLTAKKAP